MTRPIVPDYELVRLIGRGAYGEVWLARNIFGTCFAVKVVYRKSFDHDRPFEREYEGIQKFEPISRTHESQVNILHVGRNEAEGYFYYVMELADAAEVRSPKSEVQSGASSAAATSDSGPRTLDPAAYVPKTLKQVLRERVRLPVDECLEIGRALTTALAHLHTQGLVHRDVKPSNIIFVKGRPKLADIGLVASVDATQSITMGTLGYLAPTQPGTPQADLYSLGMVLYEISTGGTHREFPALPDNIATAPDRQRFSELNAIIVKACQIEAGERYQTAEAMRADLDLLRAGRSVKRSRAWHRTLDHAKTLPLAVGALVLAFALVYSLPLRKPVPPSIKLSKIPAANHEYETGLISLHTGSDAAAKQAIEHFELATRIDPRFAAAWAQLAAAHISTGTDRQKVVQARAAAEEALKLDPKLAEGYATRASAKLFQLDWSGAERDGRKARELSPDSGAIALESALNLATMGQTNEAIQMLRKAITAGSGSLSVARLRLEGHVYAWCRQYDNAILKYNEVIEKVPLSTARMESALAQVYLDKGDYSAAIQHGRKAHPLPGESPAGMQARYDALEQAFIEGKERGYWGKKLEFEKPRNDDEGLMQLAAVYARLRRPEDALRCLNEAYERTPTVFVMRITTDPSFDRLHSDSQWAVLMEKLWRRKVNERLN